MNNNGWECLARSLWSSFYRRLWRGFEASLMGGARACFPAAAIGRTRSLLPMEKRRFFPSVATLFVFSKEIFRFFALGNQMHISCRPLDFVVSPWKQVSSSLFCRIKLFFPLSPLWHQTPLREEPSLPNALRCPQAPAKLIWRLICYRIHFYFSPYASGEAKLRPISIRINKGINKNAQKVQRTQCWEGLFSGRLGAGAENRRAVSTPTKSKD